MRRPGWSILPLMLGLLAGDGLAAEPDAPPVRVEVEVDASQPYVQGRVLLTARVLADARVLEGVLSDPDVPDALVHRLGEDRHDQLTRDGHSYRVSERRFAIFPQQSGELRIPPLVFEGRVRDPEERRPRDAFDGLFGGSLFESLLGRAGQRVRVRSEVPVIVVRSRPAEAAEGWWLPARDVELVEQWPEAPSRLRVGEPVVRLLEIRATDLSAAQLPELALPAVEGLKQYAEPASEQSFRAGDRVLGVKQQPVTLIPTRAGPLRLPALQLEWWDVEADARRLASLPARTLEVLPGAAVGAAAPPPVAAVDSAPLLESTVAAGGPSGSSRLRAGLALLASALAGALGFGLARRLGAPSARRERRRAERALRRACRASDASAATAALRALARARWPGDPPLGSSDWAERLDAPGFAAVFARLQHVRYSTGECDWRGAELWKAYRRASRNARRSGRRPPRAGLPDLYPAR